MQLSNLFLLIDVFGNVGGVGSGVGLEWSNSLQHVAGISADMGAINLVDDSPYGSLTTVGGSVELNASGGPNGLPTFRYYAASGGYHLFDESSSYSLQPFHILALVKFRTPISTGIICGASGQAPLLRLQGTTQIRANAGGIGLDSAALDASQWHLIDAYYEGDGFSSLSIDGGTRVTGGVSYGQLSQLVIGGGGSSSVRADLDVFCLDVFTSRLPYDLCVQYYEELAAKTGLTFATPAAYQAPPLAAPQNLSRPARFPLINRQLCFVTIGQSNDKGYATGSPTAPSAAVSMLDALYTVDAATNPLQNAAGGVKYPRGVDGNQFSGYQAKFCNDIATATGRPVCVSTDSFGGTTSTQWLPNARGNLPSTWLGQALLKMKEIIYWGQELGAVMVCQGEGDVDGPTWKTNWLTTIAHVRAHLGLPSLKFIFIQTPASNGVRTSEPTIEDVPNNIYFVPTTLGANLQDGVHWNTTGCNIAGTDAASLFLSVYDPGVVTVEILAPAPAAEIVVGAPITIDVIVNRLSTVTISVGEDVDEPVTMTGLVGTYSYTPVSGDIGSMSINVHAEATTGGSIADTDIDVLVEAAPSLDTLPGVRAFFVPEISNAVADGTTVVTVTNLSTTTGHANWDASIATVGYRPVIKTGLSPNGKRVIRFDGTDDILKNTSAVTQAQPCHHFFVLKARGFTNGDRVFDGNASASSGEMALLSGTPPVLRVSAGTQLTCTGSPDITSAFRKIEILWNNTTSTVIIDGVTVASGPAGTKAPNGFTWGGRFDSAAAFNGDVDLAGAAYFDGELTGADLSAVRAWMATL